MRKSGAVDQRIQDFFILLAIKDTKFLKSARQTVKTSYFGSWVTQELVQICYSFFDQFGEAPGIHFRDEIIRHLGTKTTEDADLFMTYLERIQEIDPPNQAYVISRINKFVQAREMEIGAVELARKAKEGDFDTCRELMQKMLKVGIVEEEVGLDYFKSTLPSYLRANRSNEKLIGLGMAPLDALFPRGLCRTDFLCLLGGFKGAKSFGCIYFGQLALLSGLRVLHVTHELSLEDTEKRYDMGFGGLIGETDRKSDSVNIEIPNIDGSRGILETIERPSVADYGAVSDTRRKIRRLGGSLIIKKYPMGQCTMGEIERYLDYLETFNGFVPDVFINDYIEKMKVPGGERRDAINDMYMQMKGIADERKLLSITVSQATREALQKHKLSQKDFAEDIRKLGNVDLVLAISQTEAMAQQDRRLLWMLANRNGAMDYGAVFTTNLKIGQFKIDCWPYVSLATKVAE